MSNVIFYKYKSFTDDDGNDISQWTFDSLIHKYFCFSRPEQLNDPLDCKVLNEYNANDDIIKCIEKHYSGWEKIQMYSVKILETNGSLYREKIEND